MAVPRDLADTVNAAIKSGYRWELDRAIRTNSYLRVFFSLLVLVYCGFGPGVLLRFPVTAGPVGFEALSYFYAFRPVVFAILFLALVSVMGALARRSFELFRAAMEEDIGPGEDQGQRERYIRELKPSPLPFVLSGSVPVDLVIFAIALAAYSFWVVLLVETTMTGMGAYQTVGIIIGSYGLFAAIILIVALWVGLVKRGRDLLSAPDQKLASAGRP